MNDYLGNVVGLVDSSDGSIAAAYEYDPFGRELRATGSYAHENPFRFSSQYWDEETGLVYFGFRYYHPQWGRFLNRDPLEEAGGENLYRFVSNDPVNRWDLLGLRGSPTPGQIASHNAIREKFAANGGWVGLGKQAAGVVKDAFVENFTEPADLISGGLKGEFEDLSQEAVVVGTIALAAAVIETIIDVATAGASTAPKKALKEGAEEVGESMVTKMVKEGAESVACFTAGTLILTADGYISIEHLRVGQRVLTSTADEIQESYTHVDSETWQLGGVDKLERHVSGA